MSEVEQEVEVTDEISSQDQIRSMMDKWADAVSYTHLRAHET